MTFSRFRYLTLPWILWWCGYGLIDNAHSFWHLNIRRLPPKWPDADASQCGRIFCRYCGRGSLLANDHTV